MCASLFYLCNEVGTVEEVIVIEFVVADCLHNMILAARSVGWGVKVIFIK